MKWIHFQGLMFHAEYYIEYPEEHLKILLKLFSVFKIKIIYYETIYIEDVTEAIGIM